MKKSGFPDGIRYRALSILTKHIGRQNALSMTVLYEDVFGDCPETVIDGTRKLRALITDLRSSGEPICSTTNGGYYLAAAGSELDDYCERLKKQALRKLRIVSRIQKTPLTAVCSQLELDFNAGHSV